MPYGIFQEDGKQCVYKVDSEGKKVERIKCHNSRMSAEEHLTALNINVHKEEEIEEEEEYEKAKFNTITYNGITVQATGKKETNWLKSILPELYE